MDKKVTFVVIAGKKIDVFAVVCPECKRLDLLATFDTSGPVWKATCGAGHVWQIDPVVNEVK